MQKYILIFSLVWATFASFLYFDHIAHHPKTYIDHFQLSSFYNCFRYEDDVYRKEEAMEYATKHGHKDEAELYLALGFRFLKPVFWWPGYLISIIFPFYFIHSIGLMPIKNPIS